ncbi:MAG TPA: hypothetical protein VFP93_04380 [Gammaproteobacteria bacterium]|nr:hypothetical protein [Gammaproteobacteria bacterium]
MRDQNLEPENHKQTLMEDKASISVPCQTLPIPIKNPITSQFNRVKQEATLKNNLEDSASQKHPMQMYLRERDELKKNTIGSPPGSRLKYNPRQI